MKIALITLAVAALILAVGLPLIGVDEYGTWVNVVIAAFGVLAAVLTYFTPANRQSSQKGIQVGRNMNVTRGTMDTDGGIEVGNDMKLKDNVHVSAKENIRTGRDFSLSNGTVKAGGKSYGDNNSDFDGSTSSD